MTMSSVDRSVCVCVYAHNIMFCVLQHKTANS